MQHLLYYPTIGLRYLFYFLLLFCGAGLQAQDVFHFTKGLTVMSQSRYGREAVYTDLLAYHLYSNTLQKPAEGAVLATGANDEPLSWKTIEADSLNRFIPARGGRGSFMNRGGAYLYLTYESKKDQPALLNVQGAGSLFFNGEPRTSDPYRDGWLYLPVQLKKGLNEIYIRGSFVQARLHFPATPVFIEPADATLPHILLNDDNAQLQGAVVVINTSHKVLRDLKIRSSLSGRERITNIPYVPAMSMRKVPFYFDGSNINARGNHECTLTLMDSRRSIDEKQVRIEAVTRQEHHSATFVSEIDGSLQYYSVAPQTNRQDSAALFLSVHGAGVEAIGQARAYRPKDWGTLVAATNRRPRGFNWEDWGRIDALEVLQIAKDKFRPNPQKIFLTGHSMGGHGTWFLGAAYPDKWAAIAPCAGYPTLKGYGSADGLIPDSAAAPVEQILLRSSNQSDVIRLATNYKPLGVYIFHGDSDRVVSVNYARQMRKLLGEFHTDMSYYEYPGGEHWFGDISVDWKPLFDFFQWHARPADSMVNNIDFTTSNPGISSSHYWTAIIQQQYPLQFSRLQLKRNIRSKTISGTTQNVQTLKLKLNDFPAGTPLQIELDGSDPLTYTTQPDSDNLYLIQEAGKWRIGQRPPPQQKGPHRYGTFKDAFNHRMVFVYGTTGNKQENAWSLQKARYDAETWYYRGNGAVEIISDKEFSPEAYANRGIILYGNKNTNAAWQGLLGDCPIQVERNKISAGEQQWVGDDLAAYYVWPRKGSANASVAVIAGSGLKGMKAANANQYFAGASGFPDFMVYSLDMLKKGPEAVKLAGFFDNEWKLDPENLAKQND